VAAIGASTAASPVTTPETATNGTALVRASETDASAAGLVRALARLDDATRDLPDDLARSPDPRVDPPDLPPRDVVAVEVDPRVRPRPAADDRLARRLDPDRALLLDDQDKRADFFEITGH